MEKEFFNQEGGEIPTEEDLEDETETPQESTPAV